MCTMPYSEWTRYLMQFSPESAEAAPPSGLYCASRIADVIDGWEHLDEQCYDEFQQRGFVVVQNAFSAPEISGAIEAITTLIGGGVPTYQPERWGQKHGVLLRSGVELESLRGQERLHALVLARALVEHEPRLMAMATHPGLTAFLRRVMSDQPVLIQNMVRTKPPSHGDKPWHQDLTHFNVHHSATVITAWIALDDAPLESGCLHFIPGTHRMGPAKHVFGRDYQIPDDEVVREGQVAAPVRQGACVLLNALVHHGSPPNTSGGRRLALQLTFKPMRAQTISSDERIATFSGATTG
jgi:phytanoyl-CoA hydroxylase